MQVCLSVILCASLLVCWVFILFSHDNIGTSEACLVSELNFGKVWLLSVTVFFFDGIPKRQSVNKWDTQIVYVQLIIVLMDHQLMTCFESYFLFTN